MIPPWHLHLPEPAHSIPLMLDSPHSGSDYPVDFKPPVDRAILNTGWDAYVGDLWRGMVNHGASLIEATFPRVYIDAN